MLPVAVFLLGALAPPTKFVQHTVGRSRAIHLAAETATTEVEPPSVAQCLEASFVPAVMAVSRGDVTELKLFIASAQAGHATSESVDGLCVAMDALPVQSAGRALAPEESALRRQWTALVYLTLDRLAAEEESTGDDDNAAAALAPSDIKGEYEGMVQELIRSKREAVPLSALTLADLGVTTTKDATEEALLRYAMRIVYLTLDNVQTEKDAGTRADSPTKKQPPKPFIPGTG